MDNEAYIAEIMEMDKDELFAEILKDPFLLTESDYTIFRDAIHKRAKELEIIGD